MCQSCFVLLSNSPRETKDIETEETRWFGHQEDGRDSLLCKTVAIIIEVDAVAPGAQRSQEPTLP